MSLKIQKEDVENIAFLSRVDLSENETEKITNSFGPILEMIEKINSCDLKDLEKRNFRLKNVMREDFLPPIFSENKEEILENFPEKKDRYLKTKKVL